MATYSDSNVGNMIFNVLDSATYNNLVTNNQIDNNQLYFITDDETYVPKTAGVTAVSWDSSNKKITRTINGSTADVVQFAAGSNISLTGAANKLTIAATNTDTLVKQTAKSDNVNYKILMTTSASPTSGNAAEAAYDTDITINPSTNTITATNFAGNASTATTASAVAWSGITSKPTTLSGYGITDAKIASGVITLGSNTITPLTSSSTLNAANLSGTVPTACLPSYVDDVLEYTNKASFPATGETAKIYVDKATNLTYRWSGSAYVEISPSLALGTTSSTAFRGDYGNSAYTHAVTNKGSAFNSGLYKITTNSEGHVTAATAVAKADITGLGIPGSDTNYYHTTGSWNGLTYTATANGGAGALALTIPTGTTSTTVALGNHTHTTSIATSTGTNQITLAHGGKYAITAGGTSYIFTMPSDNNTATAADDILDGSNSGTQITYAPYTTQQSKLSFDTSTNAPSRTDRLNLNGILHATQFSVASKVNLVYDSTLETLNFVFA